MAILFLQRSNGWVFSLKVVLASTAVLSLAIVLKLSVPSIQGFLVSEIPQIWRFLLSWLTPPYLYVVINGIIITIAASSRFQKTADDEQPETVQLKTIPAEYEVVELKNPAVILPDFEAPTTEMVVYDAPPESRVSEVKESAVTEEVEEDFTISRSDWSLTRTDSTEILSEYAFVTEKPLVSVRFGHRKSVKASPEGKALGVSRPKRNETLESTWKTITDGRPMPLARHLKKSDTWETHGRQVQPHDVKKSETFNERKKPATQSPSLSPSPGSGKLRKERSQSQDELNRRVEAFIKKFNDEIRLQRQESFKHYQEMIKRGSH